MQTKSTIGKEALNSVIEADIVRSDRLKLVEKILLLESTLGGKSSYNVMESFEFNSSDANAVQNAGKKIAEFIGLRGLIFLVTYSRQKTNVGGHIDIDNSNEVFIEIEETLKTNSNMVLAVLAHEICHKYLHSNNVQLSPVHENEILTDVTTVYTGLGKLSLNGCEISTNISIPSIDPKTTTTRTTTQKVGYLDRQQFAFVYRLVSEMNKKSKNQMLNGLNADAANIVRKLDFIEQIYFDVIDFNPKSADERLFEFDKNHAKDFQKSFARLYKNMRLVQENLPSLCLEIENKYKEYHYYNKENLARLSLEYATVSLKDSTNYIKNLWFRLKFDEIQKELKKKQSEAQKSEAVITKLRETLREAYPLNFLPERLKFLLISPCPICNHKHRVNINIMYTGNGLGFVTCDSCRYRYILDTLLLDRLPYQMELSKSPPGQKQVTLWRKVIYSFAALVISFILTLVCVAIGNNNNDTLCWIILVLITIWFLNKIWHVSDAVKETISAKPISFIPTAPTVSEKRIPQNSIQTRLKRVTRLTVIILSVSLFLISFILFYMWACEGFSHRFDNITGHYEARPFAIQQTWYVWILFIVAQSVIQFYLWSESLFKISKPDEKE